MGYLDTLKGYLSYHLAVHPRFFIPIYKNIILRDNSEALIARDTKLVIEGFPRSGNTFAFLAFQYAQPERIKIAHHLHAEAQILEGMRLQIPVLVLIRNPEEAIRSLLVRNPEIKVSFAIKRYVRFYSIVYRVLRNVVIGDFNNIISDFGQVINNVNEKFDTDFILFQHTNKNVEKIFQKIEAIDLHFNQGGETHIARPSSYRKTTYEKTYLSLPESLLENAVKLYQLVSHQQE